MYIHSKLLAYYSLLFISILPLNSYSSKLGLSHLITPLKLIRSVSLLITGILFGTERNLFAKKENESYETRNTF